MDNLNTYKIKQYSFDETIGSKLLYYRKLNNLTQKELSTIIQCNETHIKDIEKNKKLPGRGISEKLASYFKINTKYFFDEYFEDTYDITGRLKKFQEGKNLKKICNDIGIRTNTWYSWTSGTNYVSRKLYPILKEKGIL